MAIYHLRVTMISRSAGRSATAAAAYRSGERIEDRRTGLTFDYRARSGVDHTEILAPENSPEWVHDRAELWNAVEASETRKNSQVAREIRVALPAELNHEQRLELVRDFTRREFVARGMIADVALHAPSGEGDERNHHAHILLTTREIEAEGFTTKNRDWNAVEVLEGWREAWARDCNAALERAGSLERIDHRTLEAQRVEAQEQAEAARGRGDEIEEMGLRLKALQLDRDPLPQLSLGAWQLKERGFEVAAVKAWHEVKANATEAARVIGNFAVHLKEWLVRPREEPQSEAKSLREKMREIWSKSQEGAQGRETSEEEYQSMRERLRGGLEALGGAGLGEVGRRVQDDRLETEALENERKERVLAEERARAERNRSRGRGLEL